MHYKDRNTNFLFNASPHVDTTAESFFNEKRLEMDSSFRFATLALHADSATSADIAAPLHVSTTFVYPDGYNENAAVQRGWLPASESTDTGKFHIYSRESSDTRNRVEAVLGALEKGYAVTYSSGLAAIFALFVYAEPKVYF
jgi:cystathionine gamma-synthase